MDDIHSCSYYCTRPECIKAQRDELRDRLEAQQTAEPVAKINKNLLGSIEWLIDAWPAEGTKLYASPRITTAEIERIKRLASLLETQVRSVHLLGDNTAERKEMVEDVLKTRAALRAALDALKGTP